LKMSSAAVRMRVRPVASVAPPSCRGARAAGSSGSVVGMAVPAAVYAAAVICGGTHVDWGCFEWSLSLLAPSRRPIDGRGAPSQESSMAAYSDQVVEHFTNPRNSGVIESPEGEATTAKPVCGDRMHVMLR